MTTHSSILAWEIPWTEEPGWLQPTDLQRLGHDLATKQQKKGNCFYIKRSILCKGKTTTYTGKT